MVLRTYSLLSCPRSVQRRCVVGLAPGEESCDDRQLIGQCASRLLRICSRRWIHLIQEVDCGSQREDSENVDVVVSPFGPPVSKVQKVHPDKLRSNSHLRNYRLLDHDERS